MEDDELVVLSPSLSVNHAGVVDESSAVAAMALPTASLNTFAPTTDEHPPSQPLFQIPATLEVADPVTSVSEPAFVEPPPVASQPIGVTPAAVIPAADAELPAAELTSNSFIATQPESLALQPSSPAALATVLDVVQDGLLSPPPVLTPPPMSDLAESDSFATPTLHAAHLGAVPDRSATPDSSMSQPTSLQVESSVVQLSPLSQLLGQSRLLLPRRPHP
jgi:hypothetical protein